MLNKFEIYTKIVDNLLDHINSALKHKEDDLLRNIINGDISRYTNVPTIYHIEYGKYTKERINFDYKNIDNTYLIVHEYIKVPAKYEEELIEVIKEIEDLVEDTEKLQYYIRSVLNICENTNDVKSLLPHHMYKFIPNDPKEFNNTITLSEQEIKDFKLKYKEYESIIEQRILTNLLCV